MKRPTNPYPRVIIAMLACMAGVVAGILKNDIKMVLAFIAFGSIYLTVCMALGLFKKSN
jgi:hypothetical protein